MSPNPQATISITTAQSVQQVNDLIKAVQQLTKSMQDLQRTARATGKDLSQAFAAASNFKSATGGGVPGQGPNGQTVRPPVSPNPQPTNPTGVSPARMMWDPGSIGPARMWWNPGRVPSTPRTGGSGGGGSSGGRSGGMGGGRNRGSHSNDPLYRVMDAIAWILPAKGEQLYGSMRGLQTLGMSPFAAGATAGIVTGGLAGMELQTLLARQTGGAQSLAVQTGTIFSDKNPPPPTTAGNTGVIPNALDIAAQQHLMAMNTGITTAHQQQYAQLLAASGQYGMQDINGGKKVLLVDNAMTVLGMDIQTTSQMLRDSFGNLQMSAGQLQQALGQAAQYAVSSGVPTQRISELAANTNMNNLYGPGAGAALSTTFNAVLGDKQTASAVATAVTGNAGMNNVTADVSRLVLAQLGSGNSNLTLAQVRQMETTQQGAKQLGDWMMNAFNTNVPVEKLQELWQGTGASLPMMPDGTIDYAALQRMKKAGAAGSLEAYTIPPPPPTSREVNLSPTQYGASVQYLAHGDLLGASLAQHPPQAITSSKEGMQAILDYLASGNMSGASNTAREMLTPLVPALQALSTLTSPALLPLALANVLAAPNSDKGGAIAQGALALSPLGPLAAGPVILGRIVVDITNGTRVTSQSIPISITTGNTAGDSYQGNGSSGTPYGVYGANYGGRNHFGQ